jgi:hypothetical protein
VFLITGLSLSFVILYSNQLLRLWAARSKSPMRKLEKRAPVRSYENFAFHDGVSQPGIRGPTPILDARHGPNQGLLVRIYSGRANLCPAIRDSTLLIRLRGANSPNGAL